MQLKKVGMISYKEIPNHFSFADIYDEAVDRAPSPATFVEVGTWFGASAAYMATKIRESGKLIKFFAIDNFTAEGSGPALLEEAAKVGGDFYELFRHNMERCGVSQYVEPFRGDSTQSASMFGDQSLDFVYIDACHDHSKVRMDILAWLPKIKLGGTIAGHDYNRSHRGVRQAVDSIFKGCNVRIQISSWIVRLDTEERRALREHLGSM